MHFTYGRSFKFIFVIASLFLVPKNETGRDTTNYKLNTLNKYISKFTPEFYSYYLKNTPFYQENVENMKY